MTHHFHPHILRASDIRGIVGEDLTAADATLLGRCFAEALRAEYPRESEEGALTVVVGWDGRLTSPALADALRSGLMGGGVHVIQIGVGPTPMLYYGVKKLQALGGIMITGSHNPAPYNGFKMLFRDRPFFGPDIQNLAQIAQSLEATPRPGGTCRQEDIRTAYVQRLLQGHQLQGAPKRLRIAWDPGNGAVGAILPQLRAALAGAEHFVVNEPVDGLFPAHHPDPTVPENLIQLRALVAQEACDLGIAFDGDGDRIGVIDREGDILWGDQLLAFYSQRLLQAHPGATIITDIKASQVVLDFIQHQGGTALMVPSGHSIVKARIRETGALLAGEMSGHLFFADDYYGYDDAVYAAVRLIHILAHQSETLVDFKKQLPQVHNTPELRFPCPDAYKFSIMEAVRQQLDRVGANYIAVDGARVQRPEGWWLLRASNTQDVLVARCEADGAPGLATLKQDLRQILLQALEGVSDLPADVVSLASLD